MHPQVFHRGESLEIGTESDITCYGLRANSSPTEELVGRYGGLTLAELSAPLIARFHTKYAKSEDCWLWTGGTYRHGYGMFGLGRSTGKLRTNYAHRIAYVLAYGAIPAGYVVRHTCDVPACVNPEHLILGTQGDNNRDTAKRRRTPKTRPWLWKLGEGDVQAIRTSLASGDWLAKAYGVSKTSISLIRRDLQRMAA